MHTTAYLMFIFPADNIEVRIPFHSLDLFTSKSDANKENLIKMVNYRESYSKISNFSYLNGLANILDK